jgi:L-lactate utilization protein LutB
MDAEENIGPKRQEVAGSSRKWQEVAERGRRLHNEVLHNLRVPCPGQ